MVTAGHTRLLFTTYGNILEAHLVAWESIIQHEEVTRGTSVIFYDAQSPAAVIAKMAKLYPRFNSQLLLRPYGPLLWRLHRLWTPHSHVTAIKVGSHLASDPNADADHWTTRVLDYLGGATSVNPLPGPPVTDSSLHQLPRFVWPLTFLGSASRLRDVTAGSLEAHVIACSSTSHTPRFHLQLREVAVERFHHKARASQLWTAKTAMLLATRTASRTAHRLGIPLPPTSPVLTSPVGRCPHGCTSRVDSSDHMLECVCSAPLQRLRLTMQTILFKTGVPESASARLSFHPGASQQVLLGHIPDLWQPILGSGCSFARLQSQITFAYRSFVADMTDDSSPAIQLRRANCQLLRQADYVVQHAQSFVCRDDGGLGFPPPDPAVVDAPHCWAVVIVDGQPQRWVACDQPDSQGTLLTLPQTEPTGSIPSHTPPPSVSSVSLSLALALHGTELGNSWAAAGVRLGGHPKIELQALYSAVITSSSQPWEHCPAGTYPLFPTPTDLLRLLPAAVAASRAPSDPHQTNRQYRMRPGEFLFGQQQGCYTCGATDHFQAECPN